MPSLILPQDGVLALVSNFIPACSCTVGAQSTWPHGAMVQPAMRVGVTEMYVSCSAGELMPESGTLNTYAPELSGAKHFPGNNLVAKVQ